MTHLGPRLMAELKSSRSYATRRSTRRSENSMAVRGSGGLFSCVGLRLAMPGPQGRSICLDALDAVEAFLQIRWAIALPVRLHPLRHLSFTSVRHRKRIIRRTVEKLSTRLSLYRAVARRRKSVGRRLVLPGPARAARKWVYNPLFGFLDGLRLFGRLRLFRALRCLGHNRYPSYYGDGRSLNCWLLRWSTA